MALQYARCQNEQMCLESVKRNWRAFEFAGIKTEALNQEAVRQNGLLLEYIQYQPTPELALEAVKQNGRAVAYVREGMDEIYREAILQTPEAVCLIDRDELVEFASKEENFEICKYLMKQFDLDFMYIEKKILPYLLRKGF